MAKTKSPPDVDQGELSLRIIKRIRRLMSRLSPAWQKRTFQFLHDEYFGPAAPVQRELIPNGEAE